VSPFLVAYSVMSAVLRSAVIDIGNPLSLEGLGCPAPGCRPGRAAQILPKGSDWRGI
jgi:hypothetical protein